MNKKEQRIKGKLKVGMVLKNYIEICKIIEVEPTRGNGRKYHIREFERYCSYKRSGHKYIITKIYDKVLPAIDNRGKHLQKYDNLFDNLILSKLVECKGHIVESYSGLVKYQFDFFTSENEKLFNIGYREYAKTHNMSRGLVMMYQKKTKNVISSALNTSLNRLQRQDMVKWSKEILIRDRALDETYADEIYKRIIKNEEERVYKKLKIKSSNRIITNINRKFKKEVCKALDILNYYWVYDIRLINKDIKQENIKVNKDELVKRFIESTIENTKNSQITSENGIKYKPYSHSKFAQDIIKLTNLLWQIPAICKKEYSFVKEICCNIKVDDNTDDFYSFDDYVCYLNDTL